MEVFIFMKKIIMSFIVIAVFLSILIGCSLPLSSSNYLNPAATWIVYDGSVAPDVATLTPKIVKETTDLVGSFSDGKIWYTAADQGLRNLYTWSDGANFKAEKGLTLVVNLEKITTTGFDIVLTAAKDANICKYWLRITNTAITFAVNGANEAALAPFAVPITFATAAKGTFWFKITQLKTSGANALAGEVYLNNDLLGSINMTGVNDLTGGQPPAISFGANFCDASTSINSQLQWIAWEVKNTAGFVPGQVAMSTAAK